MPSLASRYQSGTFHAESDSSSGLNGPAATPKPSGAGMGVGAGGKGLGSAGGAAGDADGAVVIVVAESPKALGRYIADTAVANALMLSRLLIFMVFLVFESVIPQLLSSTLDVVVGTGESTVFDSLTSTDATAGRASGWVVLRLTCCSVMPLTCLA
jgi:hypothetical protein